MKNFGFCVKNLLRATWLVALMAAGVTANAMCPVETYTNGDNSIDVEYKKTGTDEYCIVISSTKTMEGLGGSFAATSGGNVELRTVQIVSADKHTIAIPLTSTTDPVIYTPIYVLMPGEVNFGQPAAISWCDVTLPPAPENGSALAIYSSHYCGGTTPGSCINPDMDYYSASHYKVKDYWLTPAHVIKHYTQMGVELSQNGVLISFGNQDVSDYTFLHIDVYIPNEDVLVTTMGVSLQENVQWYIATSNLQYDAWNSFDIPMSAFTVADKTQINRLQFRFAKSYNNGTWTYQNPATEGYYQVFVDNIYFYVPEGPRVANLTAVPTTNSATLTWTAANFTADPVAYTVQYSSDGGTNWTTVSTTATSPYTVTGLNSAVDYTFKVSGVSGLEEAEATVDATTTLPLAPTYTHFPDDVLSIFSTQYGEEIAGAYQGAAWSDASNGTYAIDGSHTVKKYDMAGGANSNKGILWLVDNLGASFGDYDKLHVDIFIPDDAVTRTLTKIAVWGGELDGTPVYETSLTLNAWNSFDVPNSRFGKSNTNRMCIVPMVGDGYPTSPYTLYLDNYFIYNGDETCEFSREMLNVQNTTRIEGAGVMIYFEGYGTEYAQNAALYTVTARATGGAMTPNIQAAAAEYLYVTLGRAPGANELTEITLTHQDGAAVKMKFQGGTLISTRDVCGQCPDSPEPEFIESSADKKHLYVSRYTTVNNFTDLHSQYSSATCTTNETAGGLDVLKFNVTRRNACAPNSATLLYSTNAMFTDVTDMDYIHLDIYLPDNGTVDSHYLRFGLQENYIVYPQEFVLGEWNSFDIPLNAFNLNFAALTDFRLSIDPVADLNGTAPTLPYNMYVDNVYFFADASCGSSPAAAAATPNMPESAVVSLFSDAYTTGVASFRTNDGTLFNQNNSAELVQIGRNNTYFYDNIYHLAFEFSSVDITAMHGMSVDLWAEKPMTIDIRGGNGNTNQQFGKFELHCGWNHVEFDITDAQKTSMSNAMTQLYIHAPGPNVNLSIPADIYLDNLYFFTTPITVSMTKRLAKQKVCQIRTSGAITRVQVYDQAATPVKHIDQAFDTPVADCMLDIRDLPVETYTIYLFDEQGRTETVRVTHMVY